MHDLSLQGLCLFIVSKNFVLVDVSSILFCNYMQLTDDGHINLMAPRNTEFNLTFHLLVFEF